MDDTTLLTPSGASADCARFDAQCGGYLERDLDATEQAWMTAHQSACADCAALVHDLEAIVAESQALPGMAPSRDLWSGIEARLDTTVIPILAAAARTRIARTVSVRSMAIAATMLVAVTSGITWRLAVRGNPLPATPASTPPPIAPTTGRTNDAALAGATVAIVEAARDDRDGTDADVVYEREISALRRIIDDRVVELDSVTVRELRRNLDIIDQAIRDSRQALARDPRSALAATHLDRALETKLALLRRVALL